jgi:hypothetical protein
MVFKRAREEGIFGLQKEKEAAKQGVKLIGLVGVVGQDID